MITANVDSINAANIYPTYGGSSTFLDATGIGDTIDGTTTASDAAANSVAVGASGNPFRSWLTVVVLLVALMWTSQKYGDGSYGNLKLSAYNILTVTLSALIGLTLFKALMIKWPVPGLATLVAAA